MFFHYCGLLGHDLHHCALHFTRKKNGDGVDYQYGEWLKSKGGRAKSPPKQSAHPRRGFDADAEDVLGQKSNHIGVVVELPAVERETTEHMNNCDDEGNLVNFGIVPESQQHENKGIDIDFKGVDIACIEDNSNVGQGADNVTIVVFRDNLNLNKESSPMQSVVRWASEGVGPSSSQTQGKWTRLNQMEFGLSGITKAFNLPTLGKRGSYLGTETDNSLGQEEQAVKCGRFNESSARETDISAGVVSYPC